MENKEIPIPGDLKKATTKENNQVLTASDLKQIKTKNDLLKLLKARGYQTEKSLINLKYGEELVKLQIELVKLQQWRGKFQRLSHNLSGPCLIRIG